LHTQTTHHEWRIPAALWWVAAACFLAYSWQHLAGQTMPPQNTRYAVQGATPNGTDLVGLLSKIDQTAQAASIDVARLRIEKWKADSSDKQQAQSNADSVQRNMTAALPGMTGAVRTSPQDFAATFKLYRNLNALYDVMKTLTEASAAFGAKQDFQTLAPYTDSIDGYRRSLADYMETLAASKDAELARLRSQAKTQAAAPPKKTIIDDNEPATKKTAKKKAPKLAPPTTNPQ
jgi:hypothetical protein